MEQKREQIAPVIVFTYNRPEHTKRTIEALAGNDLAERTDLYIYSDAPKREADRDKVQAVRDYAAHVEGFASVHLVEREENFGLAKNIIRGVTEIVNQYGVVIVLEDDLITNRFFLQFMNDALHHYKDCKRVTGVTGFSHFDDTVRMQEESYFHTLTGTSWSWGTWEDRWRYFDEICVDWTEMIENRRLRRQFNYDNSYDFYRIMKMQQTDKNTNSWAIRWYWANFKKSGYILSPTKSLVSNEGWDGTGEHCGRESKAMFYHMLATDRPITYFPSNIAETSKTRRRLKRILRREYQPSLIKRVYNRVARKNYVGKA